MINHAITLQAGSQVIVFIWLFIPFVLAPFTFALFGYIVEESLKTTKIEEYTFKQQIYRTSLRVLKVIDRSLTVAIGGFILLCLYV
jgi:hypothetical protein